MSRPDHSGTIMVIDDKPSNLRLLESMLSEQGYRVRIFPKGALAIASARKDPPDLILLDINMPEMSGYEVCRHLKMDHATQNLPIIFISAMTETMDKVKAFKLGGVDYITKPFQLEEVDARISLHLALRRTKAALEEKNRMLETTLKDLKAAQMQLVQSEKMAALGTLVAGIAHEINNPVNFIKSSIIGLGRDMQDLDKLLEAFEECARNCADTRQYDRIEKIKASIDFGTLKNEIPLLVDNIHQGVQRTEEIIGGLRSYSRMDDVPTKGADIHHLIDTALVILKNRCKQHITIEKQFDSIPDLAVNPGKLIQVLVNLISNAIDAIESMNSLKKGRITIKTAIRSHKEEEAAIITISDNGAGIHPKDKAKIFDPFFTTKPVGKGTGLGLSISIGIIEEHQGRIEVNSTQGQGSTFTIVLPVRIHPSKISKGVLIFDG